MEDPHGPCIPCRKSGWANTCNGRTYPSRKDFQPKGSSDAHYRLAGVAAWADAAPPISTMGGLESRDKTGQVQTSDHEWHASVLEENGALRNNVGKVSVPQQTTQMGRHQDRSRSPPTKLLRDFERDLATLLSTYDPSADPAMVATVVSIATHIFQKNREQKGTGPVQTSVLSGFKRYEEITKDQCVRGIV